jgi:hypothetical protein
MKKIAQIVLFLFAGSSLGNTGGIGLGESATIHRAGGGGSGSSSLYPALNVKAMCGAKGDDTTDDAPAFQTCLNTMIAAGTGALYIPCGTYKILSPLIINSETAQHMRIFGDGSCSVLDGFSQNIPLILAHPNWTAISTITGLDPNGEGRAGHLVDNHGWIALSDLNGVSVNGQSGLTVELWYQPDETGASDFIIGASGSKSLGSAVEQGFYIQNNSGSVRAHLVTTGNPAGINLNGGALVVGHKYYLALTYDSATTRASLYVGESPGTAVRVDTNAGVSGTIVQPRYEDIVIGPQFNAWRFGKVTGSGPHGYISNVEINKVARWSAASITIPGSVAPLDGNAVIYFSFESPTDIGFYARDPGLDAFVYEHRDSLNTALTDIEVDHLQFKRANTVLEFNTVINANLHDLSWTSIFTDGLVLRNNSFGSSIRHLIGTGCVRGSHVVVTNSGLTPIVDGYLVGGYVDIFGNGYSGTVRDVYTTPGTGGLYDIWLQGGGDSQANVTVAQASIGNETGTYSEAGLCLDSLTAATVQNVQFESANASSTPAAYVVVDRGDDTGTSFPVQISDPTFRTAGVATKPTTKIQVRGTWTGKTIYFQNFNNVDTDAAAVSITDHPEWVVTDPQAGIGCTITGAATSCSANFARTEMDTANMTPICVVTANSAGAAANSWRIKTCSATTSAMTATVETAPTGSETVTIKFATSR